MSLLSPIVDTILTLHGAPAYALVGGLAFAEAALFVGFVLPGETAVVLGGVLAHEHRVSLPVIAAVAVLAAIIGDSVGYEVGRQFGTRLLASRLFARHRSGLAKGQQALRTNGGRAVFLARFTAFLRAAMPGLAGTARMPYRRFLAFNAAGGLVWALGFTLLGYLAGASYRTVEKIAGRAGLGILAVIVIAAAGIMTWRRHRDRANPTRATSAESTAGGGAGRSGWLCAVPWGVCPEHGNTLTFAVGRTWCRTANCGRHWDHDRLAGPCPERVTHTVTDTAGRTSTVCAGHAIAARTELIGGTVTALRR